MRQEIELTTAPALIEGKTCIPIREIAEELGLFVKYDTASSVIVVSTGALTESEQAGFIQAGTGKLPAFIESVTNIVSEKPYYRITVGETLQLNKTDIIFTPKKIGCDRLLYSSDNTSVATVTSQGRVKAVGKGTAKITVSSHNGKTTVISVTVS